MLYGVEANGSIDDYSNLRDAVYAMEDSGDRNALVFCPTHGQDPVFAERIVCSYADLENGKLKDRMAEEAVWVSREQQAEKTSEKGKADPSREKSEANRTQEQVQQQVSKDTGKLLSAQDAPDLTDPSRRPVIRLNDLMEVWFPHTAREERETQSDQAEEKTEKAAQASRAERDQIRQTLERGKIEKILDPKTGKPAIKRVSLKDAMNRAVLMTEIGKAVRDMGVAALNGPVELVQKDGSVLSMRPEKDDQGEVNAYAYIRDPKGNERIVDFVTAQEAMLDYRIENHIVSGAGNFLQQYQRDHALQKDAMSQTIQHLRSLSADEIHDVQDAMKDRSAAQTEKPDSTRNGRTEALSPIEPSGAAERGVR